MSVQSYRNSRTGRACAHESIAQQDPEKGYSVPIRKDPGRVDPVTNQIIPSTGKPGRPVKPKPENQEDQSEPELRVGKPEEKLHTAEQTIVNLGKEAGREKDRIINALKRIQWEIDELIRQTREILHLLNEDENRTLMKCVRVRAWDTGPWTAGTQ